MNEYIDKKQAIDRIASCYCMDCEHSNGILCRACEHQDDMDLIDDMPAVDVQPAPQWISVHDSIPSDNKPYAVVTKNNGLGVSRLMGRNKLEWTLFGEPVLYWMPLPEPPKDGDTNG